MNDGQRCFYGRTANWFVLVGILIIIFFAGTTRGFGQDVTEATLEMVPGNYGFIQDYKITFRSDRSAFFQGTKGVSLIGKYHGAITKEDFSRLAEIITKNKFASLKTEVGSSLSSFNANSPFSTIISPVVITNVKFSNKKKRTIQRPITADIKINSPTPPPKELLEIESAIINLSTNVKWHKDPK